MEENVALDSNKQKQFVKSIKGIKKILKGKKKGNLKKENINDVKIGKIKKPKHKKRGLVYLSHIPHGFYEHQMTEYFKQFGVVTNARVMRSKRTGMSKGHAFVEFKDPNVAQIVADTMNNYLMGKRLIKAALIPPEKQRKFVKRKHWNAQNNPGNDLRQKMKKAHNSIKDEKEELQNARRLISNLNKTKKRLRELDIDYDFFIPVDIPEPLINLVTIKTDEDVKNAAAVKGENKIKQEDNAQNENKKIKGKKVNKTETKAEDVTTLKRADNLSSKHLKKSKEQQSDDKTKLSPVSAKDNLIRVKAKNTVEKESKESGSKIQKNAKQTQKKKEKLKDAGVKPLENFIQIQRESDDASDSSVDFDSDEYDKVMEEDDDVPSDNSSDEDLDEDVTSEEDVSEDIESPKKVARPSKIKLQVTQTKQQGKKLTVNTPPLQPMKRMSQKNPKQSKKPKFEKKGNKKTINKVIKKK